MVFKQVLQRMTLRFISKGYKVPQIHVLSRILLRHGSRLCIWSITMTAIRLRVCLLLLKCSTTGDCSVLLWLQTGLMVVTWVSQINLMHVYMYVYRYPWSHTCTWWSGDNSHQTKVDDYCSLWDVPTCISTVSDFMLLRSLTPHDLNLHYKHKPLGQLWQWDGYVPSISSHPILKTKHSPVGSRPTVVHPLHQVPYSVKWWWEDCLVNWANSKQYSKLYPSKFTLLKVCTNSILVLATANMHNFAKHVRNWTDGCGLLNHVRRTSCLDRKGSSVWWYIHWGDSSGKPWA